MKSVIEGDGAGYEENLEAHGYSGVDENDELTSLSDDDYSDDSYDDSYDDEYSEDDDF